MNINGIRINGYDQTRVADPVKVANDPDIADQDPGGVAPELSIRTGSRLWSINTAKSVRYYRNSESGCSDRIRIKSYHFYDQNTDPNIL